MGFPVPASLLITTLALIIFAGGFAAYRSRRHRMAQFGDSVILGISRRSYPWILSSLLYAAAAVCMAAAVMLQPVDEPRVIGTPASLEIVLDVQSMDRRLVPDAVRVVMEESPPCRVSIHLAGNPPGLLVPPTMDMQGALMVMSEQLNQDASQERVRQTGTHAARVVFVSGRAAELADNFQGESRDSSSVAFVTQASEGSSLLFGIFNPEGELMWSSSPRELREFLTRRTVGKPRRLSAVQWLVLLGFVFIAMESIWELVRP
jgi:hypothetical protein